MWVEEKNGVRRLVDRYKGLDGKTHRASVVIVKHTSQAHRKAQSELIDLIRCKSSLSDKIGLFEALERYFDSKNVKRTTLVNERSAMEQLKSFVGDIPMTNLSGPLVKRKLSESGKAPETLNRYILIFKNFIKWALEYGYIASDIQLSPFPVKAKEKKADSELYLEPEELHRVLDLMDGTMDGYLCKFMALTGCRVGEATALTLSDIDDYVHVTKTSTWLRDIQEPKTVTSKRDIFIQPELRTMLREYYQWRSLYMMAHGVRTDLLFFGTNGKLVNRGRLGYRLKKIDPKLHPHIFRHTHVALMAEQGISLGAISQRLGHADSSITKRIYYHVTEKTKKRDEEAIAKVFIL